MGFARIEVSFEEAVTIFHDPLAKIANDPEHSEIENRSILAGPSSRHPSLKSTCNEILFDTRS